ncbi:serine/threonine protein kinase [Brevibacillus sp. SYSU BS000544]|uniref:serine/threonine protein kinase n=1 Tax=Brevibacillus sp. SYSU BS000544 TaxID=3416443 RepID=UPI003CE5C695
MLFERILEFIQQWRDRPLKPRTTIGKYQIESVIGSGSYGIAYLVKNKETNEIMVAKQVKKSRMGKPKGVAMQQYEADVLAKVSHLPYVPKFIEIFSDKNRCFLVMSYVHGHALEDLLFEQHVVFSHEESLRLLRKIACVVQSLHEQGLIHRDVRIPNIILFEKEPYLIDFGLARFMGDKPTYESPDLDGYPVEKQLKREVHPRSDLYAMGHLLLFLLYSSYDQESTEEKSWQDELQLDEPLHNLLKRLLQLDTSFESTHDLIAAIDLLLEKNKKQ